MAKYEKVRIIPVKETSEVSWLITKIKKEFKDIIPIIDKLGRKYDHEIPWCDRFLADAKNALKRVTIGAIGRVNTCEDAIKLGVINKIPAKTHHFTSTALYYMFRIARQKRREVTYIKDLERWLNFLQKGGVRRCFTIPPLKKARV